MAQAGLRRTGAYLLLAGATLILASCAETATRTAALPPVRIVPGSLLLPAASPRPISHDTCGATALAGLIGKPRTQIPVATDLSRRRVSCTACPVSPDIRLDRVNILYDAQTGLVAKITCG